MQLQTEPSIHSFKLNPVYAASNRTQYTQLQTEPSICSFKLNPVFTASNWTQYSQLQTEPSIHSFKLNPVYAASNWAWCLLRVRTHPLWVRNIPIIFLRIVSVFCFNSTWKMPALRAEYIGITVACLMFTAALVAGKDAKGSVPLDGWTWDKVRKRKKTQFYEKTIGKKIKNFLFMWCRHFVDSAFYCFSIISRNKSLCTKSKLKNLMSKCQ